jgi:RNA polymerase sigma-70 factor (ECF subfamily)
MVRPAGAITASDRPTQQRSRVFTFGRNHSTESSEQPMNDSELSELVERARSGDHGAFNTLVAEFEQHVFAVALRRLRNRALALEVTQDVFVQVLRKLGQLREATRFAAWVRRIAVRLSINCAVRRPREVQAEVTSVCGRNWQSRNPLERVVQTERADAVRECLGRLRELDRKTLVAFYFEGRSLQEMSREFASPVGTIKRRLHTARNRLRVELGDLQLVG